MENYTYQNDIKSVVISVNGVIEAVPMMRLNSRDFMILTFDDLSNSEDDYFYRFVHCDRDWNKSEINELDYIDGFNDEILRVWEFSEVTEVNYTHFWIQLPNRDTRLKISGNYILYVYQKDGSEEIPILTRRFIVSEDVSSLNIQQVRSSQVENDRFYHQFDLTVGLPSSITNPMTDVTVEIIQNGMWNESVKDVEPFSINDGALKFDPFGSVSFPALAEFRSFDTRIRNGGGRGVEAVTLKYGKNIAYLYPDLPRNRTPYLNVFDFNGKFYVDAVDALRNTTDAKLEKDMASAELRSTFSYGSKLVDGEYTFLTKDIIADYVEVHFTLKSPYLEDEVYVFGAFTDWQLKPEYKMAYDFETETYTLATLLKQGYYDYMYALKTEDGINLKDIEGSWYDTENEYTVITYYREFATRYDKVLSVRRYNSLYDR